MTEQTLTGEQRERAKSRRKYTIIAVIFVVGMISGFLAARAEDWRNYDFSGPWAPEVALGILAAFLITVGVGTLFLRREMDDYEKMVNLKATAFAAGVVMIGYPVWFLLWKASLVIEPVHWVIFLAFYASLYPALLYYRFR